MVSAAVLKGALDTLLNIISTHLKKKFLILAAIAVSIQFARFWLDKHLEPQKVIYYENAHHQHHYETPEEHGSGSWWGKLFNLHGTSHEQESPPPSYSSPHDLAYNGYSGYKRSQK